MDLQFMWMIFRTVIALLFVIFLIYISAKYGGEKLKNVQKGKFIRIMEREQLSKENSLLVVKIGEKMHVVSSASGKIEIIYELNEEEVSEFKNRSTIPEYKNLKDFYTRSGMEQLVKRASGKLTLKKLIDKKEDK
ncbi:MULTISPECIES: flagellar biosynthetic protein FliO [Clostridium]|uniref:Flagellar biosynthesis protein, FliO n=2 Tax=Clostridium TaxID=1485 RepID=A0A170NII2_9CLOT|nr:MULTISPECIES: flagellar biosynthetic protein FliO [Clostridium]ADK14101.1 putative flagellar biogenesis protein FliO [Clostridium ljungdahlii DSM 13528]OAA86221.1 hypothetical protein WX45_04244 [Clostridium ljungdahlii DSM 13528]OAA89287.1 hypothetical protein WX73_02541 [Clostridium coskatii]OBR97395.1 hypothetical protein CLCOS_04530 [Clostridium coskatii]